MEIRPSSNQSEQLANNSVPEVKHLTTDEYTKKKLEYASLPDSQTQRFHDINLYLRVNPETTKVVYNEWGETCLIIWIYDRKNMRMVFSGHFLTVNKEKSLAEVKEFIKLYKEKQRSNSPRPEIPTSFGSHTGLRYSPDETLFDPFEAMSVEISQLIHEVGDDQVEVYLFGQNRAVRSEGAQRVEDVGKNAIEHFQLTTDLRALGVLESHIHDFRNPALHEQGDDTFFVVEDNVIYHHHRT